MAAKAAVQGAIPKVLPPPSPFGELLRRSHFAAYDPKIRQTYTAPASYISRGNWGLKRPIANKKRHSDIVLRNFEEHAQFIEWDKASAQVNLIKRVEELNVQPTLVPGTPWAQSLGPTSTLIDSEFAPEELLEEARLRRMEQIAAQEQAVVDTVVVGSSTPSFPSQAPAGLTQANATLDHISSKGKGQYGTKVKEFLGSAGDSEAVIQPNIAAMVPKQFEQYLEELRGLRPAFLKYVREELKKSDEQVSQMSDEYLIMSLSPTAVTKCLHRFFLGLHTQRKLEGQRLDLESEEAIEEVANAPQPIQARPHKHAGLMYANPTKMETYYSGKFEPGYIIHDYEAGKNYHASQRDTYVTAFAGLSASLRRTDASQGVTALFDPSTEEGIRAQYEGRTGLSSELSERPMRMVTLRLEAPPTVVGAAAPNKPLHDVELRSSVVVEGGVSDNMRLNPHKPGSHPYAFELPDTARFGAMQGRRPAQVDYKLSDRQMRRGVLPSTKMKTLSSRPSTIASYGSPQPPSQRSDQVDLTLDTLKKMSRKHPTTRGGEEERKP